MELSRIRGKIEGSIAELENIYEEGILAGKGDLGWDRLARWKRRVSQFIAENVSAQEAQALQGAVDDFTDLGDEITRCRDFLVALLEEIRSHPDTVIVRPAVREAAVHLDREAQRHGVVLLHGIRTHAVWAEMVKKVLEDHCEVEAFPIRYGYFDVFRFLSPILTRRRPLEIIERELRDVVRANPGARISVIAHSFGTYAIAKVLEDNPDIPLDRLVLCGSIVPVDYRWDKIANQVSHRIVNDCGTRDIWPLLARSITWGFGPSGTFGFSSTRVRSRFHDYKHSDFFKEEFVRQYWVPYFRTGDIVGTDWETRRPTPPLWHSFVSWFPLKLVIILVALVGFALGVQFVFKKAQPEFRQDSSTTSQSGDRPFRSELNISGVWLGNTGRYMVSHDGTRVVWDGIGSYGNKVWHHRGEGTVDGYTVRGRIEELADSNFPGHAGGSPVEGTIAINGQTISWTGMNPQERIWQRGSK